MEYSFVKDKKFVLLAAIESLWYDKSNTLILLAFIAFLGCSLLFNPNGTVWAYFFLFVCFFWILQWVSSVRHQIKQLANQQSRQYFVEVNELGIRVTTEDSSAFLTWSSIIQIIPSKHFLFIVGNDTIPFLPLPRLSEDLFTYINSIRPNDRYSSEQALKRTKNQTRNVLLAIGASILFVLCLAFLINRWVDRYEPTVELRKRTSNFALGHIQQVLRKQYSFKITVSANVEDSLHTSIDITLPANIAFLSASDTLALEHRLICIVDSLFPYRSESDNFYYTDEVKGSFSSLSTTKERKYSRNLIDRVVQLQNNK